MLQSLSPISMRYCFRASLSLASSSWREASAASAADDRPCSTPTPPPAP